MKSVGGGGYVLSPHPSYFEIWSGNIGSDIALQLEERLKREGTKTHKEKVEEFNHYLSNLSEHHDMPRIGPG